MRKYYSGITLFKVVGALMVVVAHLVYFPNTEGSAEGPVQFVLLATRVVVPCFFVISGFLACQGWMHAADPDRYVRVYLKRILLVYAVFCLYFLVKHILPGLWTGGLGTANVWSKTMWLFDVVFFQGPFVQLWFIPPLLLGVAAVYALLARGRIRLAVSLGLVGFLLSQLAGGSLLQLWPDLSGHGSLYSASEVVRSMLRRYVGFGFTYILSGALAGMYADRFLSLRVKPWLMPILLLTVLETGLLMEFVEWNTDYLYTFTMLPLTLLLFYGVMRIPMPGIQKRHRMWNTFSIVTFFAHVPVQSLLLRMMKLAGWERTIWTDVASVPIVLAPCIVLTYMILRWTNRRRTRLQATGQAA